MVIKYVPYVGDSKRAMDEYTSEIFMGGHNTIVLHNTCEDSLLAAPIILDLVILAELCERIEVKRGEGGREGRGKGRGRGGEGGREGGREGGGLEGRKTGSCGMIEGMAIKEE